MSFDGQAFGTEIVDVVRAYFEREVTPLREKVADLEARLAEAVAKQAERPSNGVGEAIDGLKIDVAKMREQLDAASATVDSEADRIARREADAEELRQLVTSEVKAAVAAIPAPKDGLDADPAEIARMVSEAVAAIPAPENGKDADLEVLAAMVAEQVAEAVSTLPVARDGKDADPAEVERLVTEKVAAIPAPRDGANADLAEVERMVQDAVSKAVAAIPQAKDGADGVGLAGALIDRDGQLVVTLTSGDTKTLGPVIGKDGSDADPDLIDRLVTEKVAAIPIPKDGKDGKDGFSLSDFDTEMQADGRTLLLKFTSGDTIETHELQFPTMIYRGVFKDGETYQHGDTVTWAGSLFHCNAETGEKPGDGAKAWTLAAKRGRDGKDNVPKPSAVVGPVRVEGAKA